MGEIQKFRAAQDEERRELEKRQREAIRARLAKEKQKEVGAKVSQTLQALAAESVPEPNVSQTNQPSLSKQAEVDSENGMRDREGPRRLERKPSEDEEHHASDRTSRSHRRHSRERSSSRQRRNRDREGRRSKSRERRRSKSRERRRSKSRERRRSSRSRERSRRKRSRSRDGSRRTRSRSRSRSRERKSRSRRDADKTSREDRNQLPVDKPRVKIGLKLQPAVNPVQDRPRVAPTLFQMDDEAEAKPMRALVPLDYTEEEKLATAPLKDRVAASVARISKRADGTQLKVCIPVIKECLL